ncbi:MAG: porin [Maritimibacter sp.]
MKKILLASTMLVGTAGFAAADVSFSGSAGVGVTYNLTTTTLLPEAYTTLTAKMSTTTDGGLETGAYFTLSGAGRNVEKDPNDNEFGTYNSWGGGAWIGSSTVYLAGSWGKVTVAYDTNADSNSTTPGDWDITTTYTNTWGNFGLEAYGVITGPGSTATTGGDLGLKVSYDFGNYGVYLGVGYDNSDADGNKVDILAGANASISGFTASADLKYDLGSATPLEWTVKAGYATGPYSVSAWIDEDIDYGLEAGYDLGGGVGINAGYARSSGADSAASSIVYAGVKMSF